MEGWIVQSWFWIILTMWWIKNLDRTRKNIVVLEAIWFLIFQVYGMNWYGWAFGNIKIPKKLSTHAIPLHMTPFQESIWLWVIFLWLLWVVRWNVKPVVYQIILHCPSISINSMGPLNSRLFRVNIAWLQQKNECFFKWQYQLSLKYYCGGHPAILYQEISFSNYTKSKRVCLHEKGEY